MGIETGPVFLHCDESVGSDKVGYTLMQSNVLRGDGEEPRKLAATPLAVLRPLDSDEWTAGRTLWLTTTEPTTMKHEQRRYLIVHVFPGQELPLSCI